MKVYEIKPLDEKGGGLIASDLSTIADCMSGVEDEEVGNKYILEVKEMGKDEYENLPEWEGF